MLSQIKTIKENLVLRIINPQSLYQSLWYVASSCIIHLFTILQLKLQVNWEEQRNRREITG